MGILSKTMWSRSRMTQSGVELLWSRRKLTTKVGNNLGLSSCAVPQSAVTCVIAYFRRTELLPGVQERSGILMKMRMEHIKDINLRTKELGYNYWSTYTKSRIGGVQVTSLNHDPIEVDNRSSGAVRFDSRKGILLGGGLASTVSCVCSYTCPF